MYRLLILGVIVSAGQVAAEDCSSLGLPGPYLTDYFCDALQDLGDTNGTTRGIEEDAASDNWSDIGLLRDAYRADPRKTLELIKRIKSAGGLADK